RDAVRSPPGDDRESRGAAVTSGEPYGRDRPCTPVTAGPHPKPPSHRRTVAGTPDTMASYQFILSAASIGPILPRAEASSSSGEYTTPFFLPRRTCRVLRMSSTGLPDSTTRSASLPTSMLPSRSSTRSARAPLIVAILSTSTGG